MFWSFLNLIIGLRALITIPAHFEVSLAHCWLFNTNYHFLLNVKPVSVIVSLLLLFYYNHLAGFNKWRDPIKPAAILQRLCKDFKVGTLPSYLGGTVQNLLGTRAGTIHRGWRLFSREKRGKYNIKKKIGGQRDSLSRKKGGGAKTFFPNKMRGAKTSFYYNISWKSKRQFSKETVYESKICSYIATTL